jgi:hypothetical protein
MGATPWSYFVPFEPSVATALAKLRQRVFEAGDFWGSEMNPATFEEAMENMDAEGTGSIIDMMMGVSQSPALLCVCPLLEGQLESLFGTARPTHEMVESSSDFYEDIERGQGIYIVVHKDDKPAEYFFAGYSFD